ncbi:MAG: glycosyltransferase family 2 protein [Pseudomonadota bacterium]
MAKADTQQTEEISSNTSGVEGASVLVAIPTLNEADHIEKCIRSLITDDDRIQKAKFVVADGGSTDATCETVRELQTEFANLHLIANPKKLQSAAINQVARDQREAQHTCLIRCDAHADYPKGFVMAIADSLAEKQSASVVVCMDAVGKTNCFQKANAWVVDTPLGSGGAAHRGGAKSGYVDHGHHAGFNLSWFDTVAGYDERFSHNEDAELDQRLTAAGGKIWLNADVRLDYFPRDKITSLARQYYSYGRGRAKTIAKHKARLKLRQLAPIVILIACVAGLLLSPVYPWALLAPIGYGLLLTAASLWGCASMNSPCGVLAGPAAGTMHIAWATGFIHQRLNR